jgi:hypothetical protein
VKREIAPRSAEGRRALADQQILGLGYFADDRRHPIVRADATIAMELTSPDADFNSAVLVVGMSTSSKSA